MYDVIVIGAGPSGLNAARRLAERGLKVLVLEAKKGIGQHVICTGIVGREAFRKFDLSQDSILEEIKNIKIVSPFSSSLSYSHPNAFACVVDRKKFDQHIGRRAQEKGVKIELESMVKDISVDKDSVEVITRRNGKQREKYRAQIALIATGVNYRLHKKLHLGYPKDFLKGVQAELNLKDGECTHVFVGTDVAQGAFAWSVPIGEDKVRIGLMTEDNPKACFYRLMEKFYPAKLKYLDKDLIQVKPIAQGIVSKTYADRLLTVGEAAGQVKTTTGGGIYFGLLCSDIASEVITKKFEQGCFKAHALAEYEKLWKKAIRREILIGYYARKICGKLNNFQIEQMFQIAQSDGIIPLARKKGDFDWHSELILALLKKAPLWKVVLGFKTVRSEE